MNAADWENEIERVNRQVKEIAEGAAFIGPFAMTAKTAKTAKDNPIHMGPGPASLAQQVQMIASQVRNMRGGEDVVNLLETAARQLANLRAEHSGEEGFQNQPPQNPIMEKPGRDGGPIDEQDDWGVDDVVEDILSEARVNRGT